MTQKLIKQSLILCLHLLASFFALLLSVVATAAEEESASAIPTLGGHDVLQALLSLVLVTVLIFGTAWLIRRFNPAMSQNGKGMKIISALSLGGRDRVVLIDAGGRQLLLGVSPGRIVLVESFDEPVLNHEEKPRPAEEKFRQLLHPS